MAPSALFTLACLACIAYGAPSSRASSRADAGADITLLAQHAVPAMNDAQRTVAYAKSIAKAFGTPACMGLPSEPRARGGASARERDGDDSDEEVSDDPLSDTLPDADDDAAITRSPSVAVVIDSGLGHLASLALSIAPETMTLLVVAPHDARYLAPGLVDTLGNASAAGRSHGPFVRVLHSVEDMLSYFDDRQRVPRTCAIILDWIPTSHTLMGAHIAALAQMVYRGVVATHSVPVPFAVSVQVTALQCPQLSRLWRIDNAVTEGVDMHAAFPPTRAVNASVWALQRPTASHEWKCRGGVVKHAMPRPAAVASASSRAQSKDKRGDAGLQDAPDAFFLPLAALASTAARGSLPISHTVELRSLLTGHVDALAWSQHIYLDDGTVLVHNASWAPAVVDKNSDAMVAHSFPDRVVPVMPEPHRVFKGLVLKVRFEISEKLVWSASILHAADAETYVARADDAPASPSVPLWHVSMLNDAARNRAYGTAIRRAVSTGAGHVLELGAGAGLLSVIAAGAGASHVAAVEGNPDMLPLLRATLARNGANSSVRVYPVHSSKVSAADDDAAPGMTVHERTGEAAIDARGGSRRSTSQLPRRADVLVHEIFDYTVTGEGVVPSVADALGRLTTAPPHVRIIPARVRVMAVLVESPGLFAQYGVNASRLRDMPGLRRLPWSSLTYPINLRRPAHSTSYTRVSAPFQLYELDFSALPDALKGGRGFDGQPLGAPIVVNVTRPRSRSSAASASTASRDRAASSACVCVHAVVSWFELAFDQGEDLAYSTGPDDMAETDHWYQSAEILHGVAPSRDRAPPHAADPACASGVSVCAGVCVHVCVHTHTHTRSGAGGFPAVRSKVQLGPCT